MFSLYTDFGREAYFPAIITKGAVLYKDIFNTFICPLSYLSNAVLIKIFGQNLNVFYTAGAANAFAILSGIYLISREFLNRNLSLAISIFIMFYCCFYTGLMNYLTPYSYAVVYGLCAVIFSLLFYIKYLKNSKTILLYTAFFFSGIAVSCKYEYILFSLILFVLFFVLKPDLKKFVLTAASFLSVPFICLTTLIIQGLTLQELQNYFEILRNFVQQPYIKKVYATSFYFDIKAIITSFKNFFSIFSVTAVSFFILKKADMSNNKAYCHLLYLFAAVLFMLCLCCVKFIGFCVYEAVSYMPVLVLILFIIKIKEIIKDKSVVIIVLSSLVISSKCFWYLANNFYGRYFLPLLIVSLFIMLTKYYFKPEHQTYLQKSLIFIVVLLGLCSFRLNLAGLVVRNTPVKTPTGTIYSQKDEAQSYNSVLNYVINNTKPDETIVVLGAAPLINFLAQRNSINFYNHFDEAILGAYGEKRIISAYTKTKPDYFIIFGKADKNYDLCHTYGKNICRFIQRNYTKEHKFVTEGTNDYVVIYHHIKN